PEEEERGQRDESDDRGDDLVARERAGEEPDRGKRRAAGEDAEVRGRDRPPVGAGAGGGEPDEQNDISDRRYPKHPVERRRAQPFSDDERAVRHRRGAQRLPGALPALLGDEPHRDRRDDEEKEGPVEEGAAEMGPQYGTVWSRPARVGEDPQHREEREALD